MKMYDVHELLDYYGSQQPKTPIISDIAFTSVYKRYDPNPRLARLSCLPPSSSSL